MNDISARKPGFSGGSFKAGIAGAACGVALTLSLTFGIGHAFNHRTHGTTSSGSVVQAAPAARAGMANGDAGRQAIQTNALYGANEPGPPPSVEYRQYRQGQNILQARLTSDLPALDEYRLYRQSLDALRDSMASAPPPVDELRQYRQRAASGSPQSILPMPTVVEQTKY